MRFIVVVAAAAGLAPLSKAIRPAPLLDQAIIDALPFQADFTNAKQVLELPCPECRVGPSKPLSELPLDYEARPGETFPQSVLRINISIANDGDNDQLMLNDCSFYPAPSRCTTIWTDQFVSSPCGKWEYAASPEAAFALTMNHVDDDLLGLGIKVRILHWEIGRLASKLIVGQKPEIVVKLIIFPSGKLAFSTNTAREPTKGPASHPNCSHHNPHGHHRHHHHHHHHRHHNWCSRYMGFLKAFVLHALIPVISSLIMAVAAFYIWRKRFLQRQRSLYSRVSQVESSKDEGKIRGYVDDPNTPLLDEDTSIFEEAAITEKSCK